MIAHPPNAETAVFVGLVDGSDTATRHLRAWAYIVNDVDPDLSDYNLGALLVRAGLYYMNVGDLRNRSHLIDRAYVGARWREAVAA